MDKLSEEQIAELNMAKKRLEVSNRTTPLNILKKIFDSTLGIIGGILGIIFIIIMIFSWLRFFGIVETKPQYPGEPPCEPNYMGSCDPR